MSTKFAVDAATVYAVKDLSGDLKNEIPVGIYSIAFDKMRDCFYLIREDDFDLPAKMFGKITKYRDRILGAFNSRDKSTGVLLAGAQGSGKSLLAKSIAISSNLPVIKVTSAHSSDKFIQFLDQIPQSLVIIFDEFEKVYHKKEDQDSILTIFDGMSQGKRLFVATVNEAHKISEYMINRPGRFFYRIDFGSITEEMIREYCKDKLGEDSEFANEIVAASTGFKLFSFDMLSAVCEERLRSGDTLSDIFGIVNARPIIRSKVRYTVGLINRVTKKKITVISTKVHGEIFANGSMIYADVSCADMDDEIFDEILKIKNSSTVKDSDFDSIYPRTMIGDPKHRITVFTYMTDDYYVGSFDGTRMFVGNKDCAFALTICVDYDFNRLPY